MRRKKRAERRKSRQGQNIGIKALEEKTSTFHNRSVSKSISQSQGGRGFLFFFFRLLFRFHAMGNEHRNRSGKDRKPLAPFSSINPIMQSISQTPKPSAPPVLPSFLPSIIPFRSSVHQSGSDSSLFPSFFFSLLSFFSRTRCRHRDAFRNSLRAMRVSFCQARVMHSSSCSHVYPSLISHLA